MSEQAMPQGVLPAGHQCGVYTIPTAVCVERATVKLLWILQAIIQQTVTAQHAADVKGYYNQVGACT